MIALNEIVYDDRIIPNSTRCLLLNQGYQPVGACGWQRAICMVLLEKADLVEEYGDWAIRSVNDIFPAPAVLRLRDYSKLGPSYVKFSRENVYTRDGYVCQYCSKKLGPRKLTLDHVVPRSQNGKTVWDNIVTACISCNFEKADRTPKEAGMPLLNKPVMPNGRHPGARAYLNRGEIPEEWVAWIH